MCSEEKEEQEENKECTASSFISKRNTNTLDAWDAEDATQHAQSE